MITLINLRFIIDWILRTLSNRNRVFREAEFQDSDEKLVTKTNAKLELSIPFITDIIIHYVILICDAIRIFFLQKRIIRFDNLKREFACLTHHFRCLEVDRKGYRRWRLLHLRCCCCYPHWDCNFFCFPSLCRSSARYRLFHYYCRVSYPAVSRT